MITNPAARTRSLYMWEKSFLCPLEKKMTWTDLRAQLSWIWFNLEGVGKKVPTIRFEDVKMSYCLGRSLIVLKPADMEFTTLAHEITHARGFGSLKNPHSPRFVYEYMMTLGGFGERYYLFAQKEPFIRVLHKEMKRIKLL